jgi:hypothetical protein
LMAIVGAMTLARRSGVLSPQARVVPGSQQLPLSLVDPDSSHEDPSLLETDTTDEAARLLGVEADRDQSKRE